jgi:hypothetical protein
VAALPGGRWALIVAAYDGWVRLLVPAGAPEAAPRVAWSFHAEGAVGSTPVLHTEGDLLRAVFTDQRGSVYRVAVPLSALE